jgi:peptidoglycan/LPS O-acetylase OafA/YrhL
LNNKSESRLSETAPASYPWLDFLRFAAAVHVVLNHFRIVFFASYGMTVSSWPAGKTIFFAVTRTGQEAVLLFFAISGFLVGGSCIRQVAHNRFQLKRYAIDRFTRIYTPLLPVLLLTALGVWLASGRYDLYTLLVNIFSLQGVLALPIEGAGALWSLSYEVWFYILAGAICALLSLRSLKAGSFAVAAIVATCLVFSRLLPAYLFVWLFGAFIFCLPRPKHFLLPVLMTVLITAVGITLMELTIYSRQVNLAQFSFLDHNIAIMICGLGWALVVYLASHIPAARAGAIAKWGSVLASFSYTLYLTHLPIQFFLEQTGLLRMQAHTVINLASLMEYLGIVFGVVVISYGLYWLAERHTGQLRELMYHWAGVRDRQAVWRARYPAE